MSAHPAEVRDAIQLYIEQAYRPVLRFHVHKAVTDRLETYTGQVGSQMLSLERDGKIAKHVSPSGTEYWYSPKSETFCGTCVALARRASTRTLTATVTCRLPEANPRARPR